MCLSTAQAPHNVISDSGSNVTFEWQHRDVNVSNVGYEIWFVSRKNQRLLLRVSDAGDVIKDGEYRDRIEPISTNDSVGFSLGSVTRDDMGTFALAVPKLRIFNCEALLLVKGELHYRYLRCCISYHNYYLRMMQCAVIIKI